MKILRILIPILTLIFSGCSKIAPRLGPTPDIENFGLAPQSSMFILGPRLSCEAISSISKGPTWNGIQIGVTKYDEVIDILSPDVIDWNENFGYLMLMQGYSTLADTCFLGDKVSALLVFNKAGYPDHLDGLLSMFGRPDYVSWGPSLYDRSLIWSEEGVLATVNIEIEEVGFYIFFSPISEENLMSSWLVESIGEPDFNAPPEDLPPKPLRNKDPWGFNENSQS